MFKHDCKTHGHRFEPRYDYVEPEWMKNIKSIKFGREQVIDCYEKRYVHDVCVRCGAVIYRTKTEFTEEVA